MKTKDRVIGRCTLVEVRKEDYAQKYVYENGTVEWLSGWNRASDVKVGDTGIMKYCTTPSYGLPFFFKEGVGCGDSERGLGLYRENPGC